MWEGNWGLEEYIEEYVVSIDSRVGRGGGAGGSREGGAPFSSDRDDKWEAWMPSSARDRQLSSSYDYETMAPTFRPTEARPTFAPSRSPTIAPTYTPSLVPFPAPSLAPTDAPTYAPSLAPSLVPTRSPTDVPT